MFHKMPKSLSRQVRHIMSPWSLNFEHVPPMPPFTVTSLSYHPLLPGWRVTPVFHKMPKSLSRQVRHIMSPWSFNFEHVLPMPPFTVTSLSYHPLLPDWRVTPVFHKMPKFLSRQVRHSMSPWSLNFEHVPPMPPFTVTSLSYHPLLPGWRVTPVFHKMPTSLSRQVRHIMSPWSFNFEPVSPMPPFTRDKSMICHLPIDKAFIYVLKSSPHTIVQHQASLDDYPYIGPMMKHGRVHNSEAISQNPEGILDYPSARDNL